MHMQIMLVTTNPMLMQIMLVVPGCVDDEDDCSGIPLGVYAQCSDCSKFIVCGADGDVFAVYTCPDAMEYDVTISVCNFAGMATCG